VEDGEVDALVPERVWREISKGLTSDSPLRLFEVLASTGALARVMPGFVMDAQLGGRLACAVAHRLTLPARFALACLASPQPELLARHLKAPTDVIDFARLLPLAVQGLDQPLAASAVLSLVEQLDGLRKPERFTDLVQAAACVLPDDFANTLLPRWLQGLQTARAVDAGAVARACAGRAGDIKAAVRAARLEALLQLLPLKGGRADHPA
ncbi:MAG: tRNA CCA-pyrophosphorylase, partial [Pusillimonas sp.]